MQLQRDQMVEQQVRAWEVLDPAVLDAMQSIPRDSFLPEKLKTLANSDVSFQLKPDFLLPCPSVQGKILQTLELEHEDSVYLIGAGSGYLAACLAFLGGHVTISEADEEIIEPISVTMNDLRIKNISFKHQDWNVALETGNKKYDRISSQYAFDQIPQQLEQALNIGGRAVLFTGKTPLIQCVRIERIGENEFLRDSIFETELSAYPAKASKKFVF